MYFKKISKIFPKYFQNIKKKMSTKCFKKSVKIFQKMFKVISKKRAGITYFRDVTRFSS